MRTKRVYRPRVRVDTDAQRLQSHLDKLQVAKCPVRLWACGHRTTMGSSDRNLCYECVLRAERRRVCTAG